MASKIQKIKWVSSNDRNKWLTQRNSLLGLDNPDIVRFGSSEVSTVLGISRWESRFKMFYNKMGRHLTEKNSLKLTVGNRIEPLIADIMESWSGDRLQLDFDFSKGIKHRKLTPAKFFMTNTDAPFLLASIDYYTTSKHPCPFTGEVLKKGAIWETKNPAYMSYKDWEGKVPEYYKCQVIQQLGVSGFDKGYLAILAGSDYPDLMEINYEPEYFKYINAQCEEFGLTILKAKMIDKLIAEEKMNIHPDLSYIEDLEGMIQQLEPEVDGLDATKEFLEDELYPESNSLELQGDDCDNTLCKRYKKAIQLENNLKTLKTQLRNQLTLKMEDFETLKTAEHKVTNRRTKSGRGYFNIK